MTTRHGTLVANTAASVSIALDRQEVKIVHAGNVADPIYARADGTAAVIAATDTYMVPSGQTRTIPRPAALSSPTVTSLICAGTAAYEVELSDRGRH